MRELTIITNPRRLDEFKDEVSALLTQSGYAFDVCPESQEKSWVKGDGVWIVKSHFKFAMKESNLEISAWIDVTYFFGVKSGESGLSGFYAAMVKSGMKKILAKLIEITSTEDSEMSGCLAKKDKKTNK